MSIDLSAAEHAAEEAAGGDDWRVYAALQAAAPLIEAAVREQVRDAALQVLQQHGIECTGVGEVSCRGCLDRGWMSWMDYREHLANLIARGERP